MTLKDRQILGGPRQAVVLSPETDESSGHLIAPVFSEVWDILESVNTTLNSSNKNFTVPVGVEWQLLYIRVSLATTATAGNRQLEIQIRDNAGNIMQKIVPGVTQAASLTYGYNFAPGMPDLTAVRDTSYVCTPLPTDIFMLPFWSIKVWDNAAKDAAADDMSVYVTYAWRYINQ